MPAPFAQKFPNADYTRHTPPPSKTNRHPPLPGHSLPIATWTRLPISRQFGHGSETNLVSLRKLTWFSLVFLAVSF